MENKLQKGSCESDPSASQSMGTGPVEIYITDKTFESVSEHVVFMSRSL